MVAESFPVLVDYGFYTPTIMCAIMTHQWIETKKLEVLTKGLFCHSQCEWLFQTSTSICIPRVMVTESFPILADYGFCISTIMLCSSDINIEPNILKLLSKFFYYYKQCVWLFSENFWRTFDDNDDDTKYQQKQVDGPQWWLGTGWRLWHV